MFRNNNGGRFIGFGLLFIGIGLLLSTLLTWGWFMIVLGIVFIILGTYLTSCR